MTKQRNYRNYTRKMRAGNSFEMMSLSKKRKPSVITPTKNSYNLSDYYVFSRKTKKKTTKKIKYKNKGESKSISNPYDY